MARKSRLPASVWVAIIGGIVAIVVTIIQVFGNNKMEQPLSAPTSLCPGEEERQQIDEHHTKDAQIEDVYYKINESPEIQIRRGETIVLAEDAQLELTKITYLAEKDLPEDNNITLEAYYQQNDDCFNYKDGRFSAGTLIKKSETPLPLESLTPGWTINRGWKQILLVLIHYYPGCDNGCFAIEDRFSIYLKH